MKRLTGVFEPPRDIEGLRLYRLVGPGFIDVSAEGIGASGTAVDRPISFNGRMASVAVILSGAAAALLLDRVSLIMPVVTVAGAVLWVWHSWKEAETKILRWTVPWSKVEHMVQIPQHPDRFAVILADDPTHPDTLYFTPEGGPEAVLEAMREFAPITVETEAAAQAVEDEANAPAREDEDDLIF